MLSPRDYTKQENLIADALSEFGLRYDQQVSINQYTADFYVPELEMVIEADGVYGHFRKRDLRRDSDIRRILGIDNILHIKDTTKQGIKDTLWQALNNLQPDTQ